MRGWWRWLGGRGGSCLLDTRQQPRRRPARPLLFNSMLLPDLRGNAYLTVPYREESQGSEILRTCLKPTVSYPSLCNKFSQHSAIHRNTRWLSNGSHVSELWSWFSWVLCLLVSYKAVESVSARAGVSFEDSTGEVSAWGFFLTSLLA